MNPSLILIYIHFSPYMICPIIGLSCVMTQRNTNTGKSICPFTTSSCLSFEKLYRVVVSWKSGYSPTLIALINFNFCCMKLSIFSSWLSLSFSTHKFISSTLCAFRFIAPSKEIFFKPLQQCFKLFYLLTLQFMYLRRYNWQSNSFN